MAKKKPANSKSEAIDISAALAAVVAAGPNGTFAPENVCKALEAEGLAEYSSETKDSNGFMAIRATEAGVIRFNAESGTEVPGDKVGGAAAVAATGFVIEAGIPVPSIVGRGGKGGSKYPFDALEVGQSFFVPNSEAQPDAHASMGSTVSGATQRYATDHPTESKVVKGKTVPKKVYSRKFILRKVEGGCRVWRVEVGAAE